MEGQIINNVSSGDAQIQKLGFKMTKPALGNWPDATVKFLANEDSEEIKEIGEQLIERFRPDLVNLSIAYMFKQKAGKSGENLTLGTASAQPDKQTTLHGYKAIIEIGFDTWIQLDPDSKFRLIFHELAHLEIDNETGKVKIIPHLVEEFPSVVKVFGPGSDAEVEFINAYQTFQKNNGR